MIKPVIALVSIFFLGFACPLLAAPHAGGAAGQGRGAGQAAWGGAHVGAWPGHRHYHGAWHGGYWGPRIGVYYGGPGYWGGWPGVWGAWGVPYAYGYGYGAAPIVVHDTAQTQTFIQQEPAPAVPAQGVPGVSYWYYCTQPAGYYPYVKDCSQAWLKVVPQAPSQQPTAPRVAP